MATTADGPAGGSSGRPADVLHPDPPAARRGLAAHRDVAAQADQHPAAEHGGDAGGRPVGRPGLGGGTQVEPDPGRDPEQQRPLVELHLPPAGNGPDGQPDRRAVPLDQGEVAVVADGVHGGAHGGIDVAAGEPCRPQRDRDRLREQRADRHRPGSGPARRPVQGDDLRVRPEPAARQVHGGEVGLQHPACRGELAGVGDDHLDPGAECLPAGRRLPDGCPAVPAVIRSRPRWRGWRRSSPAGAAADPVPEDVAVLATADPPEVVCTVVLVPAAAGVPDAVAVVVWASPLGRV